MFRLLVLIFLSCSAHSTTFVVTRTDDPMPDGCIPNDCSLREAIIAANQTPVLDVVDLPSGEYHLTLIGNDNNALIGDLDINAPIEIRGDNPDTTFINGSMLDDRLIDVRVNQQMSISDVTLEQGDAGNSTGGAMLITEANVTVNRVVFSQNQARHGSAIYVAFGNLIVHDSVFRTNSGVETGSIDVLNSHVGVHNSFFVKNEGASGSSIHAIFHQSNHAIDITGSVFFNNSSMIHGGAVHIGAATQSPIDVAIQDSTFLMNQALYGGALSLFGTLDTHIEAINFVNNMTENGGAIYFEAQSVTGPGIAQVKHSLFESNLSSEYGGAVLIGGIAELMVQNSTFSHNQSKACGVICATDLSQFDFTHVTVMKNTTTHTADIFIEGGAAADFTNTVISGDCDVQSGSMLTSQGGNVESPGNSCQFGSGANDLTSVLPRLLGLNPDLLAYGGPTKSHVIYQSFSVLIGNAVPLTEISNDQRYFSRDAQPDSGATEQHPGDLDLIFKDSFEG